MPFVAGVGLALEVGGPGVPHQQRHQERRGHGEQGVVEEADRQEAEARAGGPAPEPDVLVQQIEGERRQDEQRVLHPWRRRSEQSVDPSCARGRVKRAALDTPPGRLAESIGRLSCDVQRSEHASSAYRLRDRSRARRASRSARRRPRLARLARAVARRAVGRDRARRPVAGLRSAAGVEGERHGRGLLQRRRRGRPHLHDGRPGRRAAPAGARRQGRLARLESRVGPVWSDEYGGPRGTPTVDGGWSTRWAPRATWWRRDGLRQGALAEEPALATSAAA